MTTQELYNAYTEAKARVSLLQEQSASIAQQLHNAENALIDLEAQVRAVADNALIQSLLGN